MERERSQRRATRPRPNHAMSTFTTHQAPCPSLTLSLFLSLSLSAVRDAESREMPGDDHSARSRRRRFPRGELVVAFNGAGTARHGSHCSEPSQTTTLLARGSLSSQPSVRIAIDPAARSIFPSLSLSLCPSLSVSLSHARARSLARSFSLATRRLQRNYRQTSTSGQGARTT